MKKTLAIIFTSLFGSLLFGDIVTLEQYNSIHIPITPFSNMASGYQATNPGFRAVIRSEGGSFIAGGELTMDAVINGYSDDASKGSAYGQLVLKVNMTEAYPGITQGVMEGTYEGTLSICMAKDTKTYIEDTDCKNLKGNIHPERPFQWLNKKVQFTVKNKNIKITKYYGGTGDGGTSRQISLAAYHPAFGFAAPGKAFKDYQSPLVLDLNQNGKLDLVNVWDEKAVVRFDLNGTGQKVRTGWVKPVDGILFWDDGSGCVHNGTTMFGEYTHSKDGKRTFSNGFLALRAQFNAEKMGTIDVKKHPRLKIWRNWAQDGICKHTEVYAASEFVKTVSLKHKTQENPPLNEDNEVRVTGTYVAKDGTQQLIGDVWFKQRTHEFAKNF